MQEIDHEILAFCGAFLLGYIIIVSIDMVRGALEGRARKERDLRGRFINAIRILITE